MSKPPAVVRSRAFPADDGVVGAGNLVLSAGSTMNASAGPEHPYRYRVEKLLGCGSFGQVVQCRDVCGASVAIKVVKNLDTWKAQSMRESEVLKRLVEIYGGGNRGIIRPLGNFMEKGHLCLVFELLGRPLLSLLRDRG